MKQFKQIITFKLPLNCKKNYFCLDRILKERLPFFHEPPDQVGSNDVHVGLSASLKVSLCHTNIVCSFFLCCFFHKIVRLSIVFWLLLQIVVFKVSVVDDFGWKRKGDFIRSSPTDRSGPRAVWTVCGQRTHPRIRGIKRFFYICRDCLMIKHGDLNLNSCTVLL